MAKKLNPITLQERRKLAQLFAKSTQGRWTLDLKYRTIDWRGKLDTDPQAALYTIVAAPEYDLPEKTLRHNLRFIHAAHRQVPRLLTLVEHLEEQLTQLRRQLAVYEHPNG